MNPTSSGHVGIGVVDRTVLLSLEPAQRLGTISDYLCDRYAAITGRERPSDPDEQLFLESLHATEFQITVESELGVSVSLADLVEAPSPRALAEAIDLRLTSPDEALVEGADAPALVPDPGGLHEPFGLTDVQHAYWLGRSGLFELGDVSTHLYLELESEDFEPERGNTVLRRLVERHDMLRAIVRPDGRQQILDTVPEASIAYQDLSRLTHDEAEAEITAVRDALSHEVRPADQWPLFELRAQRLPDGTTRLHLSLDMLIADAASVRILLTEWAALYADPDAVLPPIGLSFRDYCTATAGLDNTTARDYWTQRLHTLPPAPELPTLPIPPGTPTRFTRRTHTLPAPQWTRLKNQAHQRGLTPSALLCAAYAETLATWAKEPHFTLNVTIGDRLPLHPDTEHLIGDFTNLVLLESDHRVEGSYTERAGMLQRQLWQDLEHRSFGGVRLIRELAREHGPARASMPVVFTSVLGYEMPGSPDRPVRGLGHAVGALSQTPQVHLDCQVVEQDEALVVSWDAVEKLFPGGVLDDAFSSYTNLLEALAETPATWDLAHPVTAPAAHLRVVDEVNSVVGPVPGGLLHEPVFAQAARTPDATAVITPTRTLTYAELTDHALHIAQGLRAQGTRPGELVAVSMHKGWEQIAAVLGILHADAAYVPIDPELPHERITYLLTHTDTRTVLTQPDTTHIDWPTTITPLTIEDNAPWYHTPTPHQPTRTPTDLAYVIFTSGSTGQPKGVMIDHRGALNTIHDINNRTQLTPHDSVLGISSLSFDLSVWDIFGTLTAGATLVLPNPGTQRDPHHWNHLLTHHHITTWNSVPALFELLTEHRNQNNTPPNTTLKTALLSGDWIPLTLPQRAKNTFPHLQLHSLGGATEASIWSIHHPITNIPTEWTSIPYGKPLTNQTMHILDHHQNPRPPYTTGHIHIGGTGVALGYWKDPQKTSNAFTTHPHTKQRLYKTGDLGRYWPDGTIEFLGREDHQVKINGYRIELGEIDTTLTTHPHIHTTLTTTHHTTNRENKRLITYIVPTNPENPPTTEDLRNWLREKLPHYMIPHTIITLDEIPLTPNGKINHKALPDPTTNPTNRTHTPPNTPTEHTLTTIWTELLNPTQPLSTTDNLFELGADSLLALRATAAADRHGLHLQLPDIFQNPTITQQALVIQAAGSAAASAVVVPDPDGLHEPFGLTDVQHAYWLGRSGLFELGDVSTHLYLELESEDFEPERGNTVLRRLVERHDMLRAIVRPDGRQQILDTVPEASIAYQDLSRLTHDEAEAEITAVRDALSHEVRPADQWPLFELRAQRLPDGTTRLHLSLDMLIADAASVRILLTEWAALYADPDAVLPPIGLSFRDYCTATAGLDNTTARDYWTQRLHTLPPAPELPTLPIPPGTPTRFTRRTHTLPAPQWTRLKNQAHQRGLTPSALLCAAYAETLATWAKEPHFTLNVTIGDRLPLHPDTEHVIGDFTNLVLLESDHRDTDEGFEYRARALQSRLMQDLEHRSFGGVRLIRELAREHGPARASMPVVFTSVLGHDMPGDDGTLPGLGRLLDGISQTPQVHLDHQVVEIAGELLLTWDAVEGLFPAGVLDDAFSAYTSFLETLVDASESWTQPAPVRAPASHLEVVSRVNDTAAPVPGGLLHEPVFAQAARTPDATAVITPTRTLTYAELTDHALHIAQGLRAQGTRPGELVAVSMHKGWEQIAAVLGILHADAAYVPIDPELPHERITYLLTHTDTRTVLTQPDTTHIDWPTTITPLTIEDNAPWYHTPTPHQPTRTPTDLAYVIFTSGSTGQPKGVMIDHRGALNTIHDINNRTQLTPHDSVLGISSLSFDLSVWDIFGTLTAGATLVLPNPGTQRDPHHWNHLLTHHHITTWNSVPALFELLTEHRNQNNTPPNTTLKTALLSGDWIPLTLPQRAKNTFPHLQLHSLGGATEASIWSIHHPITNIPTEWTSIPYGKPLTNQTMHILDHHQNPRPPYTTGHIHIGGTGVALGYWKDPQKTSNAFTTHPHTKQRLYKTGDLGRYWPDGTIEFLGREDHQVKINGYRIELGEIDTTLTTHPHIHTTLTTTHHTTNRENKRLITYIVPTNPENPPTTEDLRNWLREKLPHYMIPHTIITLDEIPLTPNGKINHKALPDPTTNPTNRTHTPPNTPTEHTLTTIWTELLNPTQPLSTTDNLFELGADSLLALRATAAADRHGLHLQLPDIFQNPTITQQALVVRSAVVRTAEDDPVGPTGMTPSQHWFLSQDLPQRHHWNDASFLLSLQRPLDPATLALALRRVLEHHDALRLRFREPAPGAGWRAEVAPYEEDALPFTTYDLSSLDSRAQKRRSIEISDELQSSLDLAEGPLLRLAYFDMGDRPHCILFLAHWLAVDHYSGRIVLEDLLACYAALDAGEQGQLPPKSSSFRSWTEGLRAYADGPEVRAELGYWAGEDRRSPSVIRLDGTAGANSLESLDNHTVRLDRKVTEALVRLLPRRVRADLSEVLCSAVLRSLPFADEEPGEGSRRVLLDLERHGRDLPVPGADVSRTVGRFSTLVPVLFTFDPSESAVDALHRTVDQARSQPGRGAGHGLLRYVSGDPEAAVLRSLPQAEIGVNYLGQVDEVFMRSDLLSVPRMAYGRQRSDVGTRFRLVDVIGFVVAGRLNLTVGFSGNRHHPETARRIVDALVAELTELARWARETPETRE